MGGRRGPEDKTYGLVVYATLRTEIYDDEVGREMLYTKFLEPLGEALRTAHGTELDEADLMFVSEEDMNLHELRNLRKMDLDYLSGDDGDTAADAA